MSWTEFVQQRSAATGDDQDVVVEGDRCTVIQCLGNLLIWIGFVGPEGTPRWDPHTKHRTGSLTLGLGFLIDHHLPCPAPPAYWPMEPSDSTTSPRSHREPHCAIHNLGPCPYPGALRRSVLSSSSPREGEEGVAVVEGVVEVAVADEEDDDDEPVKVILVPDSPPRPAYKQTHRNPSTEDRCKGGRPGLT
jgi:hypothetical protein